MKHSPAGPNLLLGWVGGSDPPPLHCATVICHSPMSCEKVLGRLQMRAIALP